MDTLPEIELLRAQLQRNHIEHVRVKIKLAMTFMNMGRIEYDLGETDVGATSLRHALEVINQARQGLMHVTSPEERASLEFEIGAAERFLENA